MERHSSGQSEANPWSEGIMASRFPWEVAVLLAVAILNFFVRIPDMPLKGEETRRGQAAREMLETGNWVVPQQQRQVYITKPPLLYWTIAATATVRGGFDRWTVRLPSAIATTLTILLIFLVSRSFLSRFGAFAAALCFSTMVAVLDAGSDGEMEPLFILLVSGSLLLWYHGYRNAWHPGWVWTIGYACAGLGMLCKGIQAPVYFVGGTFAFLAFHRDWRQLIHPSHLLGAATFAAIVGCWVVPLSATLGWPAVKHVFFGADVAPSITTGWRHFANVAKHFAEYPAEHFLLMLPWSVLFFAYGSRSFRATLGDLKQPVWFAATCVAVAFPTCLLVPDSATRYFRPMYPLLAILTGVVLQRIVEEGVSNRLLSAWQRTIRVYAYGLALFAIGGTVLIVAVTAPIDPGEPLFGSVAEKLPSLERVLLFSVIVLGLAVWLRWALTRESGRMKFASTLAVGLLTSVAVNLFVFDCKAKRANDVGSLVAEVSRQVGEHQLVSFERLNHRFTFHYPQPIPIRATTAGEPIEPPSGSALGIEAGNGDFRYFCIPLRESQQLEGLPFAWERVCVVSLDRYQQTDGEPFREGILVGRKLDPRPSELKSAHVASQDELSSPSSR